jgi:hypothetical protein
MGTLQYRTFPTPNEAHKNRNAFASSDNIIEPRGYDGTSTDRVHPLHQPLNIDAEAKSPVVACIRAFPKNQPMYKSSASASAAHAHSKSNTGGSSGGTSSSSGTISSTSIYLLLQNNKQINTSAKKEGAYASQIVAMHHMTNSSTILFSSKNLPNMSCVAYHSNTGFVYAAGGNISSLPSKVVRAISSALTSSTSNSASASSTIGGGGSGGGVHGSVKKEEEIMARPTVYYNAIGVLPSPVRSNPDAICATCDGKVIVVASGNAFYAVSGTSVPHGTWYTKEEEEQMEEAKGNEHDHDGMVGSGGGGFGGGGGEGDDGEEGEGQRKGHDVEKVLKFRQSSQVHPAIVVEVPVVEVTGAEEGGGDVDRSLHGGHGSASGASASASMSFDMGVDEEAFTSLLFLASGRECAVVELLYNPRLYSNSGNKRPVMSADDPEDRVILPSSSISCGSIVIGSPRGGIATFASPILAAVGIQSTSKRTGPLMAILTNDGLVQTRSPSCIAIPLSTIEVGTSPNDYFTLRALPNKEAVAVSYGGEGRLILFREDTVQDLADRMMKLSIDAFGSSGFPRTELSKSVEAKFSAFSYVGPEPTNSARTILRQYLEMILGLDIHGDFNGGDATSWFFDDDEEGTTTNSDLQGSRSRNTSTFVSATAVLCLVCTELAPSNPSLANRAAKSCATKIGVVSNVKDSGINTETVTLCKQIVERLLNATESHKVEVTSATPTRSKSGHMEFVEAATWLLRACGEHQHAIDIQQKELANPAVRNSTNAREQPSTSRGAWSQLKYESFLASHLGELWSYGDESTRKLVLESPATRQLLESNPLLGLGVFTASHPGNEDQWRKLVSHEDPAASNKFPKRVVELLKSIRPLIPHDKRERIVQIQSSAFSQENKCQLPLESGRALTVTYLESLVGISTKKPTMKDSSEFIENITEMHNELALLLLEGVLSERTDVESEGDSALGSLYRSKLRRLLGWSNAAVNPDTLMTALPASFLRERALVLGQLGRHEDALRIFYCELKSLDLALEYCDARFEKQQVQISFDEKSSLENKAVLNDSIPTACPYLPLVAVALKTDKDPDAGIAATIKVLSLRRQNINRSAALRLLPKNIPIAALSQSVLVPALIEGESQARRMEVVSSLLRAKYVRLKRVLTETQIKSQSSLYTVPGLKSLSLGEPIYVSKPFKARPSNSGISHFPDISITKYFFARYVVIQASIMNSLPSLQGKTLGEVQFIVAESSDDALLPSINISVKVLPPELSGCSWCVLAASPQRLDGSAILACELRYKILDVDIATGAPLSFGGGPAKSSRSFVEEIQDIEIRRAEFEG